MGDPCCRLCSATHSLTQLNNRSNKTVDVIKRISYYVTEIEFPENCPFKYVCLDCIIQIYNSCIFIVKAKNHEDDLLGKKQFKGSPLEKELNGDLKILSDWIKSHKDYLSSLDAYNERATQTQSSCLKLIDKTTECCFERSIDVSVQTDEIETNSKVVSKHHIVESDHNKTNEKECNLPSQKPNINVSVQTDDIDKCDSCHNKTQEKYYHLLSRKTATNVSVQTDEIETYSKEIRKHYKDEFNRNKTHKKTCNLPSRKSSTNVIKPSAKVVSDFDFLHNRQFHHPSSNETNQKQVSEVINNKRKFIGKQDESKDKRRCTSKTDTKDKVEVNVYITGSNDLNNINKHINNEFKNQNSNETDRKQVCETRDKKKESVGHPNEPKGTRPSRSKTVTKYKTDINMCITENNSNEIDRKQVCEASDKKESVGQQNEAKGRGESNSKPVIEDQMEVNIHVTENNSNKTDINQVSEASDEEEAVEQQNKAKGCRQSKSKTVTIDKMEANIHVTENNKNETNREQVREASDKKDSVGQQNEATGRRLSRSKTVNKYKTDINMSITEDNSNEIDRNQVCEASDKKEFFGQKNEAKGRRQSTSEAVIEDKMEVNIHVTENNSNKTDIKQVCEASNEEEYVEQNEAKSSRQSKSKTVTKDKMELNMRVPENNTNETDRNEVCDDIDKEEFVGQQNEANGSRQSKSKTFTKDKMKINMHVTENNKKNEVKSIAVTSRKFSEINKTVTKEKDILNTTETSQLSNNKNTKNTRLSLNTESKLPVDSKDAKEIQYSGKSEHTNPTQKKKGQSVLKHDRSGPAKAEIKSQILKSMSSAIRKTDVSKTVSANKITEKIGKKPSLPPLVTINILQSEVECVPHITGLETAQEAAIKPNLDNISKFSERDDDIKLDITFHDIKLQEKIISPVRELLPVPPPSSSKYENSVYMSPKSCGLLSVKETVQVVGTCRVCDYIMYSKDEVKNHKKIHRTCNHCRKKFRSLKKTNIHATYECKDNPIMCYVQLQRLDNFKELQDTYPEAFSQLNKLLLIRGVKRKNYSFRSDTKKPK